MKISNVVTLDMPKHMIYSTGERGETCHSVAAESPRKAMEISLANK